MTTKTNQNNLTNPANPANPARQPSAFLWAGVALALLATPLLVLGLLFVQNEAGGRGISGAGMVAPGKPAPDFTLESTDGRPFHLADYKGRAVFICFLPPLTSKDAADEVRSLRKSVGEFDASGAKVLAVTGDSPDTARAFHDREKLPFPVLLDKGGELARRYSVVTSHASFVVDPAGAVKYRISEVETARHGAQLIDVSHCCLDERVAAMAGGVGKAVGDFSLPRVDMGGGAMATLLGDRTQKATVVLFVSVKCPCSNAYDDRIRDLAREYGTDKGVRVVGVYSNQNETAKEIAAHAPAHGWNFPVFRDDRNLCAGHFKASVTPEAFVLDGAGRLVYRGRIDESRDPAAVHTHELHDAIEATLSGKPAPAETRPFGCAIVRDASAMAM